MCRVTTMIKMPQSPSATIQSVSGAKDLKLQLTDARNIVARPLDVFKMKLDSFLQSNEKPGRKLTYGCKDKPPEPNNGRDHLKTPDNFTVPLVKITLMTKISWTTQTFNTAIIYVQINFNI